MSRSLRVRSRGPLRSQLARDKENMMDKQSMSSHRVYKVAFVALAIAACTTGLAYLGIQAVHLIQDRIEEAYTYKLPNGYSITGHKYIDSACINSPNKGTIIGSVHLPTQIYVTEYAVLGTYIVGTTFDRRSSSPAYFVINTFSGNVTTSLPRADYLKELASCGLNEPAVYDRPPRRY